MRALLLASLLLAADGDKDKEKDSPFLPLRAVAKHFEKGMAAYLGGAESEEAWKPWHVDDWKDYFRKTLRREGAASAITLGTDLTVHFVKRGEPVYRVYLLIHQASILYVTGDVSDRLPGLKVSACKDGTAPFGQAAAAFVKAARTGKTDGLPLADLAAVAKLLPEKGREELVQKLRPGLEPLRGVVEKVAALDYDEIFVESGTIPAVPLGPDGAPLDGIIRAKLTLKEGGGIVLKLVTLEKN